MSQATILVKYVNKPNKNPKYGSVKDDKGTYYSIAADTVHQYSEGQSYNITYETSDKGYHTIKTASPASAPVGHNNPPVRNGNDPRQIFVCAIVKEWMRDIPVGETASLINAINSACEAYDETFGNGH